jgi:L,D-peptidoglycan transpeptidase YkuD (ErfK/YbiS/YcfS/YnhG family)
MISRLAVSILLLFALRGAGATAAQETAQSPVPTSSTQMLLVLSDSPDAPSGTLQRFERGPDGGDWRSLGDAIPVVLGRNGLGIGIGLHEIEPGPVPEKREGDGKSPAGVFRLSSVFGFASPDEAGFRGIPYVQVAIDLECVDDVDSEYYNRIVRRGAVTEVDWASSERMRAVGAAYETGIVVDHNAGDPQRGGGSCIFLHNWTGPKDTTAGCTAMAPAELTAIARWIRADRDPVLVQLTEAMYARYLKAWGLPVVSDTED